MQRPYLPTRSQDHKKQIHNRVLKDDSCLEPLQHLNLTLQSMKTFYWPSWVLLRKIAKLSYARKTGTDFVGGLESIC